MNIPNNAAEMKLIKTRLEEQIKREKARKDEFESGKKILVNTGILCYWCKTEIDNKDYDFYYKCKQHKNPFCHKCAWNFYKDVIKREEAPKCKQDPIKPYVDCIYEKIEIKGGK